MSTLLGIVAIPFVVIAIPLVAIGIFYALINWM